MAETGDYYFSLSSAYAYLGHAALHAMAAETGAALRYRPVRIFELFDANGGLPLAKRAPARQRYRLLELQRWRAHRALPLNLAPRHYPVDPALADRCVIALQAAGVDADGFARAVFAALWAEQRDIADPDVLRILLAAHGVADPDALLAAAHDAASEAIYRDNTAAAIAADLPPAGLRVARRAVLGPGSHRRPARRAAVRTRALPPGLSAPPVAPTPGFLR